MYVRLDRNKEVEWEWDSLCSRMLQRNTWIPAFKFFKAHSPPIRSHLVIPPNVTVPTSAYNFATYRYCLMLTHWTMNYINSFKGWMPAVHKKRWHSCDVPAPDYYSFLFFLVVLFSSVLFYKIQGHWEVELAKRGSTCSSKWQRSCLWIAYVERRDGDQRPNYAAGFR